METIMLPEKGSPGDDHGDDGGDQGTGTGTGKGKAVINPEEDPEEEKKECLENTDAVKAAVAPLYSLAEYYNKWDEAARDDGPLDQEEEHRDILHRSGAYAGLQNGPALDSFTFAQDESGKFWSLSSSSPSAVAHYDSLVERASAADIKPGGREVNEVAKHFKSCQALQDDG